jgi:hypothetical protein
MQQPDKSRVEVLKSQHLLTLKLLLLVQLVVLVSLYTSAVYDGRYFVAHEDEVINFCSARLFSETGSVRAEGCIAEDVSKIGMMNWYGPGYHLIYGSFQKLFGDGPALFIHLHFVFALLAAGGLFFLPLPTGPKLLAANTLVFSQQFNAYIFTYFPETLHLLFAVVLINVLFKIQHARNEEKAGLVVGFVVLVLIMTLVRVTTIFWLAALVGLAENRPAMIRMSMLFIVGIVLTLVYMKVFTAPPYAGEMQKINKLYEFSLFDFAWKTLKAVLRNSWALVISGSVGIYFLLALLAGAAIAWWRSRKNGVLLGALIVSIMLIAALMAFYSAHPYYFLKQSAGLVPLLIVAILSTAHYVRPGFVMVAASLVVFMLTIGSIRAGVADRRAAYDHMQSSEPFPSSVTEIRQYMNGAGPVTVLWCYNEFDFGVMAEALLPFSTTGRQPVLYTTNIVQPHDPAEVKFKLHHKLRVDYVLSRMPLGWSNLKLLHSTQHYSFYEVIEE